MKLARFVLIFAWLCTAGFAANDEAELADVIAQITKINERLNTNNIWVKQRNDNIDYLALQTERANIQRELKQLANRTDAASRARHTQLQERSATLQTRLELLGEMSGSPYETLAKIDPIADAPEVKNPFAIIGAVGYISDTARVLREYRSKLASLQTTITLEQELQALMERQIALMTMLGQSSYGVPLREVNSFLIALGNAEEVLSTALSVQEKRFAAQEAQIRAQITDEMMKLITILIVIAVIIAFAFLLKLAAKRTVSDTNRLFSINRAANIAAFCIIMLVLLFNYINNLSYFITLLGFISAGIAIAMKDWFMSLLGWTVIVIGGSIHIGDRIRVVIDGDVVVADVLEIGLTRIMLFEDVTLATFDQNRRAGRIIHIPNNFIFTHMIHNYTYDEMQTVWDGIDVVITFESNHKKALKIAKDIATKHAVGYTDLTRKHYNNLRTRYNLRTVSVEPRVFTFAHTYGVKVSIWYLTNSYATLALRSVISAEVIEAFNNTEHIKIAYPTYAYMNSETPPLPPTL
ncbi:membrane protein [Campylobacterota bacterium]|nr:membrane protein [Campylobacterota bacterium]